MDRRAFIAGVGGGLLAAPLAAEGQPPRRFFYAMEGEARVKCAALNWVVRD